MKLIDARTLPITPVWSGHTDADLLNEINHYFPTPGPLLSEVFTRFAMRVSADCRGEDEGEANCPACGTALKLDQA